MDKTHIMKKEINALDNDNVSELKAKFAEYFGFEYGATNARNLRAILTYKLQEIFLSGLSAEDKAMLESIADNNPAANLKPEANTPKPLSKGMRLRRDWKGKTYEVIVREDGKFEYDGAVFRSLSSAEKMTNGEQPSALLNRFLPEILKRWSKSSCRKCFLIFPL